MKQNSLSAGTIPIRRKNNEVEYLLLRAFRNWDFPKGMVEDGEDPWEAALRELEEETGLTKFTIPYGTIFIETKPYGKGKVARYYIVEITEEKEVTLIANPSTGIVEHHEYRWVTYEKAFSMLVPRLQEVINWSQNII